MKKLLTLIMMTFVAGMVNAQELPFNEESHKHGYEEVLEVSGSPSADELMDRVKLFVQSEAENLKVRRVDQEEHKVYFSARYLISYPSPHSGGTHKGYVNFNGTIFCKDGRYKYEITDFTHEKYKSFGGDGGALENDMPECGKHLLSPAGWAEVKKQAAKRAEALIKSMKSIMDPQVVEEDDDEDDW